MCVLLVLSYSGGTWAYFCYRLIVSERVYKSYGGSEVDGHTQQYLQEAVKSGTLVCLICIDSVKRLDPVSMWGINVV